MGLYTRRAWEREEYGPGRRRAVAIGLALCAVAFCIGAWTAKSDTRAMQAIATEQCGEQLAALVVGESLVICLAGSNRHH